MTRLRHLFRRLLCYFLKHVPEDYWISPCSPMIRGRRCKRCGEPWPQCAWCGEEPATMYCETTKEDVCRACVGI